MWKVSAGSFLMGGGDIDAQPDALPVHQVIITEDFYISEEPVTIEQFKKYEIDVYGKVTKREEFRGILMGVSYDEARNYIAWLSKKEGKDYHLPTEAQWEYVARQKDTLPIDRMCDPRIREWCYDWYAPYDEKEVKDPAGPMNGMFRCIRGGYLDNPKRYNKFSLEPYFRAALPAGYKHFDKDIYNEFGKHPIGFRVVMGKAPKPEGVQVPPYLSIGVKQKTEDYRFAAPTENIPYFRKRYLFPVPPDNCTGDEIRVTGFSASFRHHHHSPGFTATHTGDLLYSVYSTYHEYDAESGLMGARFRIGEDQWELPDVFLNPVGVNDHASLFHTGEDGKIYHFWGWPQLDYAFPFQYVVSNDNGETWSEVKFPLFKNKTEFVTNQPVNSCIQSSDGTFYLVADASANMAIDNTGIQKVGGTSVLWRSRDGLKTWENPKSFTAGRHSTAVELKNGSIFALGGKNTDINGYMPAAISFDGGDSYCIIQTCFPAMNSGQRPSILRLTSGKLIVCGDYQTKTNAKPEELKHKKGSYVAWSEDEGETWNFKQLWGTQNRKKNPEMFGNASTIGYSVMKQSPDGLIHIVCSNVHPLLHLCFNEAWLLSKDIEEPEEDKLMYSQATKLISERKEYIEYYDNGALKCKYYGGIADDGRFLLDGSEVFWYLDGTVMREAFYHLGKKVGTFTYYDTEGMPLKRITYPKQPGKNLEEWYETFWPGTNTVRTSAFFRNRKAEGTAFRFDVSGMEIEKVTFHDGKIVDDFSLHKK